LRALRFLDHLLVCIIITNSMKSASSIVVHAKLSSLQFTFDQFSLVIPVTVATRASPATLLSVERCKRNDLIVKDASNFLLC
jgi:hypothetical protein